MTFFDEFDFENIELSQHGSLIIININRKKFNYTLNMTTLSEIGEVVDMIAENSEISCLIIRGDKNFAIGWDTEEQSNVNNVYTGREFALAGQEIMQSIANLPIPSIACIEGGAIASGLELALACDIRVARDDAYFAMSQAKFGAMPSFGGSHKLNKIIGYGRSLDLILTGREINAKEALEIGLITHISNDPLEKSRELADLINKNAPISLALIKENARRGNHLNQEEALEIEADLFGILATTKDFKDGSKKDKFKGE